MMNRFMNRAQAGTMLAAKLKSYANRQDVIVLALPRGGVPVAFEVALTLNAPLDVFIVRKLGVPGHEELAMGAIAMGGSIVYNEQIVRDLHLSENTIKHVIQFEQDELTRREKSYRGNRPFPDLYNKTVILVDDGIATGATIKAAIKALRQLKPASVVVAVPVASHDIVTIMEQLADKVICVLQPENFYAVGQVYDDFAQTTDHEVHELLNRVPKG